MTDILERYGIAPTGGVSTMAQRREAALTYALWDSENTTRLETPEQYDAYRSRALALARWIELYGWELNRARTLELREYEVRVLRKSVRTLCWTLALVSTTLLGHLTLRFMGVS